MISIHTNPPIPASVSLAAKSPTAPGLFVQTMQLRDGHRVLGQAIWAATDPAEGVIQILELQVDPAIRRQGHGRALLRSLIEQVRLFQKPHKIPARRLWVGIGHKNKVVGRAFLTGEGFHHISTTSGLMRNEDQLIYVKSLD